MLHTFTPLFALHTPHPTIPTSHSTHYIPHSTSHFLQTPHFALHSLPHATVFTVHWYSNRGKNYKAVQKNLFHKSVLRDCIRVHGLHLVWNQSPPICLHPGHVVRKTMPWVPSLANIPKIGRDTLSESSPIDSWKWGYSFQTPWNMRLSYLCDWSLLFDQLVLTNLFGGRRLINIFFVEQHQSVSSLTIN